MACFICVFHIVSFRWLVSCSRLDRFDILYLEVFVVPYACGPSCQGLYISLCRYRYIMSEGVGEESSPQTVEPGVERSLLALLAGHRSFTWQMAWAGKRGPPAFGCSRALLSVPQGSYLTLPDGSSFPHLPSVTQCCVTEMPWGQRSQGPVPTLQSAMHVWDLPHNTGVLTYLERDGELFSNTPQYVINFHNRGKNPGKLFWL